MELKTALAFASKIKEKENSGKSIVKGEEIILTLAEAYATMYKKTKEVKEIKERKVDDETCVDFITFYKERTSDESNTAIAVNRIELSIILDAILERIYE